MLKKKVILVWLLAAAAEETAPAQYADPSGACHPSQWQAANTAALEQADRVRREAGLPPVIPSGNLQKTSPRARALAVQLARINPTEPNARARVDDLIAQNYPAILNDEASLTVLFYYFQRAGWPTHL